jgi:hypothetical protein
MKFQTIQLAALLMIAVAACSGAEAAVLANYQFGSGSSASSDADAGSTALAFTVHDATNDGTATGDSGLSGSTHMAFLRSEATPPTDTANHPDQAAALDDDDYFSFQVDAVGANVLNLTSLVFSFGASTGTGSSLNNTIYVQSSVDGFGSSNLVIASFSKSTGDTGGGSGSLTTIAPIDLTAAKFQGLASIQFRFFFSDNRNNTGDIDRLDNVVLNGIAIPMPAALPAGLALLAGGLMRRRGV